MENFNNAMIANFIYGLLKYSKQSKIDLEYSYNIFIINQEYEKCAIIQELLEIGYYDNTYNNSIRIKKIINLINRCDDDNQKTILINNVYETMNNIMNLYNFVIIPPLKNLKNITYFKK